MSMKGTELYVLVLDGLIKRLKSEDANTTDFANAIKFLKEYPAKPEEEEKKKMLEETMEEKILALPF